MTEAQWLACADVYPMVDHLGKAASDRKLRLFAIACCRRVWHLLGDQRSREIVAVAERYADGDANDEELAAAGEAASNVDNGTLDAEYYAAEAASSLCWRVDDGFGSGYHAKLLWYDVQYTLGEAGDHLSGLLRDVIGNPFRRVGLSPAWRTPTTVTLAQAAYYERNPAGGELDMARLLVLADALEEAGCTEQLILDHLRAPGPHVRGCFAVDLVLAKE
jgi:hypothetical protein